MNEVFGRYRLIALIGEGGMGKVYKAHDTIIGRDVAVKVLPTELSAEPGYRERFRREAHTAARLTEPHIIPIYDTGEIEGQLYLVMPVIDGIDVYGLLARDGLMSPQRAVSVIEQLAGALHAAHAVGLVHRDIKPSNALVTADDFVYLIDFGIAHDAAATKLTQTGSIVGTWAYMAPERFTTGTADARADIYALACVLYECLTGAQPYPGGSLEQQITGHLTLNPPKPSSRNPALPAGFDEVIAAGMAKDPNQRYQSARELATAARRALTEALSTPTSRTPHTAPALGADPTRPAPTLRDDQLPSPPTPEPVRHQPAAPTQPATSQRSQEPAKTRQMIDRGRLGSLSKIGQGGQGVVYRAPNVKTKFAASMVYKEYKPGARADIDFTALAAMPVLVEESLSYAQAQRLISIAAWPCALVDDAGSPTGFVMPAIPDEFLISLTTVKGVSTSTAEFQHLLNHPTVLAARGITLDDAQRCTLLRETASGLAFLHKHGVCVGDISPKNLLFSLTPQEGVYFIDCDAMRINAVSALPQVETPGWNAPPGEELATIYTDTYKLGLLSLRLLTGDQDTTNPGYLPATTPRLLRQIITDTLTNPAYQRPLPEAWTYVLGHAIEEAQHQKSSPAPVIVAPDPPPMPIVHSRPPVHSGPPLGPSAPPPTASPPPAWAPPANRPTSSTTKIGVGAAVGAAVGVALVAVAVMLAKHNNSPSSSAPETSYATEASAFPSTPTPADTPTPANTPTLDPESAALEQLQAFKSDDASTVAQLAGQWIPQISSKHGSQPWTYDSEDGKTYDSVLTLQEHQALRQRYGAKLIWSGDWTTYDAPDYWVTIVPQTFPDSGSVLSWCTSQGFDGDHCSAQIISTTLGRNGTHADNP